MDVSLKTEKVGRKGILKLSLDDLQTSASVSIDDKLPQPTTSEDKLSETLKTLKTQIDCVQASS